MFLGSKYLLTRVLEAIRVFLWPKPNGDSSHMSSHVWVLPYFLIFLTFSDRQLQKPLQLTAGWNSNPPKTPTLTQPMDPEKKSLNFIFPTQYVIPKSLKFGHWLSENFSANFLRFFSSRFHQFLGMNKNDAKYLGMGWENHPPGFATHTIPTGRKFT